MKIEFLDSFVDKLNHQVSFIARDKPAAARKFKSDILKRIKELSGFPKRCRKSIYFDDENIRDLTFKGYTVIFKIDDAKKLISVFALLKYEEKV
jgi:plasmid stabilization system protein ParE